MRGTSVRTSPVGNARPYANQVSPSASRRNRKTGGHRWARSALSAAFAAHLPDVLDCNPRKEYLL